MIGNLIKGIAQTKQGLSEEVKMQIQELLNGKKQVYIEDLCKLVKPKTIFIMMADYRKATISEEVKAELRARIDKFIKHYHETVDSETVFEHSYAVRSSEPVAAFCGDVKLIPEDGVDAKSVGRRMFLCDMSLAFYLDETISLIRSRDLPTGYRVQWHHGLTEEQLAAQQQTEEKEVE